MVWGLIFHFLSVEKTPTSASVRNSKSFSVGVQSSTEINVRENVQ